MNDIIDFTGDNEYEQIIFYDNVAMLESDLNDENVVFQEDDDQKFMRLYEDVKYQSGVTGIFDLVTSDTLSTYLKYTESSDRVDIAQWNALTQEEIYDLPKPPCGKRNPSLKQWMSFHIEDLLHLFTYLRREYNFRLHSFEEFCEFAYLTSKSKLKLPSLT